MDNSGLAAESKIHAVDLIEALIRFLGGKCLVRAQNGQRRWFDEAMPEAILKIARSKCQTNAKQALLLVHFPNA